MGLQGVELVIAVEEKFGIQLSDAEAERIETPRMQSLIASKIRPVDDGKKSRR